ncbi:DUF4249 domain-containing protein [Dyadobacter fanqingshengii]|uniref:DUF4249 domain-containing protein n=1 Tax=Dyadobacter fanqingshengii TaxID=2906443 RepID=A0A9X1P7L3_9BACT|nr:DUF4249 domain-containing protein [Dyadobacter fanqingshengii]MCF0038728.1 DUF4249 domain-containing protein [Dyadobacter fanqingshengii]USJ34440.1 DUF4249 domain-containing protein [Dyadobacter fanqingshengii]
MNTIKSIFSIALLISILSACETPLTNIPPSKLPQAESKLVVNSIISPQLPYINVLVTESIPLFTKTEATERRVENATVKLSDGVNEITIPYDTENKLYSIQQSKFPIEDSKTYYLSISDNTRSVTAKCTVPGKKPVIKSYEFDTMLVDNSYTKDTVLTLRMSWQDVPGDTNYYKLDAVIDYQYSVGIVTDNNEIREELLTDNFHFYWQGQEGKSEFMSDKYLDGNIMNSLLGKFNYFRPRQLTMADGEKETYNPKNKVLGVLLQVLNVDSNYYKYMRSIEITGNSDTPFAEPAPLYSNTNGGLGCFAAYNAAQLKIVFPNKR